MATIAEFSVPTQSFALAETLPEFPDVSVEADQIAAYAPGSTMPCIWATRGDDTEFAEALAADSTVKGVEATLDFDSECLYHITWSNDIDQIVSEMIDHKGVILEASGRGEEWLLRIRFMSREQLEAFQEHFSDRNPAITLEQLFQTKYPRHTRGDVTPEQYEALMTAVETGYFQVPREGAIREIADALGVSDQAVSERIRRGTENMVRDMLAIEPIQGRT